MKRFNDLILKCLLIIFIIRASAVLADTSQFLDKEIKYIRLECEYPIDRTAILDAIQIREGDAFHPSIIRKALHNLFLLDRFHQINVDAEPFQNGIMLIFSLEPEWTVRTIKFKGKQTGYLFALGLESRLSRKKILRVCQLYEGDIYTKDKLDTSIQAIKKLYLSYGYGQCRVDPKIHYLSETKEIVLIFNIDKGPPTYIRNIEFEGNNTFSSDLLSMKIKSQKGKRFLESILDADQEKLRSYYRSRNYIQARIRKPEFTYDTEDNRMDLRFQIREGEPLILKLSAPKHWWNLDWWLYRVEPKPHTILDVLGLGETEDIDEDLLDSAKKTLENHFQKRGYAFANASLNISENTEEQKTYSYSVTENLKMHIDSLEIEGNNNIETSILKSLLISETGNLFLPQEFDNDIAVIKSYYIQHGFQNVAVTPDILVVDEKSNHVDLVVSIIEGEKSLVSSIEFSGNVTLSNQELESISGLSEGTPYYEGIIDPAVSKIIAAYNKLGYPETSVQASYSKNVGTSNYQITLVIDEGNFSVFGTFLIKGYQKTKRSVIKSVLSDLEGKPFYIETLLDAQRKLSQTGLFSSVRWNLLESEESRQERTVVFSLRERPTLFLEAGPGYNTDTGFNAYANFYSTNLFGTNRYLGSSLFVSEQTEKTQISYREPEFSGYPIQMEIRLYRQITEEDYYRLFRYGGKANWTYRFYKNARTVLEYRLEDDEPIDIEPRASIPFEQRQSIKIGSLAPSIIYDSRDDPRDPKRGRLLSLKVEFARPVYSSEVDFTKTIFEGFQFIPLKQDQVLGLGLRFGWGRDLPFQEKFKLGGIKTIRGWGYERIRGQLPDTIIQDGLSPSGDGGDSFILCNLEWRKQLFWGLMGVVFIDTGNVYETFDDMSLKDLKTTVGLGLRFMTPIGPVGLDYGYNIQRDNSDPLQRWSFIIGHTF